VCVCVRACVCVQVAPYWPYVSQDPALRDLMCGLLNRQVRNVLFDPYANAFNPNMEGLLPMRAYVCRVLHLCAVHRHSLDRRSCYSVFVCLCMSVCVGGGGVVAVAC
jgi:meiotically up-regulated gene 157 (Mug157) protein